MKLQLQVSKQDFYQKYYQAINGILKLTNKELAILTLLSNSKFQLGTTDKELFSSRSRSQLSQILGISKFNFNNYIKSMKDRNILVKANNTISINPAIYKDINSIDFLDFTFTFKFYESN